jgi:hypothetical protein
LTCEDEECKLEYDYLSKLAEPEDILASIQGKLRRVDQQRNLATQFAGEIGKPSVGALVFVVIMVVVVAILACGAGVFLALNFLS